MKANDIQPISYEAQDAANMGPNSVNPPNTTKISIAKKPLIKNKFLFGVSMLLLLVVIYFVIDRIQFLSVAKHTTGTVKSVTARNDTCSERRNKRTYYYDCTKFTALIEFDTLPPPPIIHSSFILSAGSVRGHNEPLSRASRSNGEATKVAYDPTNLDRVYEDTISGIWWTPIYIFFMQFMTLIGAVSEQKKRKY